MCTVLDILGLCLLKRYLSPIADGDAVRRAPPVEGRSPLVGALAVRRRHPARPRWEEGRLFVTL